MIFNENNEIFIFIKNKISKKHANMHFIKMHIYSPKKVLFSN